MLEVSFDSYPTVPIVVFSSRDDALAYDTALGLRFRTSIRRERPWIMAWFHRRHRVIVMVGVKKRPRDVVRHEVVHSVIDWQVPRCPPAWDEGLAMYVSDLLLPRSEESNPSWIRRRSNRATVLGRAKALPLQELLEMSGDRFRAPRDNRNHYLSWCLVLELVEHPGLVARLFRALRSSSVSSREVFRATLPNDLEAKWKARVQSEAARE